MHDTQTLRTVCLQDPHIQRYFQDVYGADQVPRGGGVKVGGYPACCIANTDPISEPGQHWIAIYWLSEGVGEFFDSYAERPSTLYHDWAKPYDHFRQISHPLQRDDTDVCGDYCLYYLYRRCRGIRMSEIVRPFSSTDLSYNDQAVLERMHHLFPRRLQSEPHMNTPKQYCILKRNVRLYRSG